MLLLMLSISACEQYVPEEVTFLNQFKVDIERENQAAVEKKLYTTRERTGELVESRLSTQIDGKLVDRRAVKNSVKVLKDYLNGKTLNPTRMNRTDLPAKTATRYYKGPDGEVGSVETTASELYFYDEHRQPTIKVALYRSYSQFTGGSISEIPNRGPSAKTETTYYIGNITVYQDVPADGTTP